MTAWLIAVAIGLIAASYFKIYRVRHITVAYQDDFGQVRGYAFDYAYPAQEAWMNITEFEHYVAKHKKLPKVRILQMKVESEWKFRRV